MLLAWAGPSCEGEVEFYELADWFSYLLGMLLKLPSGWEVSASSSVLLAVTTMVIPLFVVVMPLGCPLKVNIIVFLDGNGP